MNGVDQNRVKQNGMEFRINFINTKNFIAEKAKWRFTKSAMIKAYIYI